MSELQHVLQSHTPMVFIMPFARSVTPNAASQSTPTLGIALWVASVRCLGLLALEPAKAIETLIPTYLETLSLFAENGLLIRPETGGTLIGRSAAITVTALFPVGAVNQPVTARIRWLTQVASADDGHVADAPFMVEAFTETGEEVVQLNRPLTLTVQYSPASLQGADETRIVHD